MPGRLTDKIVHEALRNLRREVAAVAHAWTTVQICPPEQCAEALVRAFAAAEQAQFASFELKDLFSHSTLQSDEAMNAAISAVITRSDGAKRQKIAREITRLGEEIGM